MRVQEFGSSSGGGTVYDSPIGELRGGWEGAGSEGGCSQSLKLR